VIRSRSAGSACNGSAELETGLRANTPSIKSPKSLDWESPRLLARAAKAAFWSGWGQAVMLERCTESILPACINIGVPYFADASLSCLQSCSRGSPRAGASRWSAPLAGVSVWHGALSAESWGYRRRTSHRENGSGSPRLKADSSLAMGPCCWGMPSTARRGSLAGSLKAGARESPKSGFSGATSARGTKPTQVPTLIAAEVREISRQRRFVRLTSILGVGINIPPFCAKTGRNLTPAMKHPEIRPAGRAGGVPGE
jgi:hypothetical protein